MKYLRNRLTLVLCILFSSLQHAHAQNDRYGGVSDYESDGDGGGWKLFILIVVVGFIMKMWKDK